MSDFTFYMLLAPLLMVVACLLIYWLTAWQDRRDDHKIRRRADRAAEWGVHRN